MDGTLMAQKLFTTMKRNSLNYYKLNTSLVFLVIYHLLFLYSTFFLEYNLKSSTVIMATISFVSMLAFNIGQAANKKPNYQHFYQPTKFLNIIYFAVLFFYLLIAIYVINIMTNIPNIGDFRLAAFGSKDNPSIIFENQLLALIYFQVSYFLNFFLLSFGMALSIFSKSLKPFFKYSIPFALSGLIMFDRGWILVLLFSFLFIQLHLSQIEFKQILVFFLVGVVSLGLIVFLSIVRGDSTSNLIDYVFKVNLIGYNTVGYYLFESEIDFLRNTTEYGLGRITFGGIENILYLVFKSIGFEIKAVGAFLNEYFQLKTYSFGDVSYNAFYTVFTPLLLDFNIFGVLPFFLLVGMFYRVFSRKYNFIGLMLKFHLFVLIISFNQKPLLNSMGFSISFFILVLYYIFGQKILPRFFFRAIKTA